MQQQAILHELALLADLLAQAHRAAPSPALQAAMASNARLTARLLRLPASAFKTERAVPEFIITYGGGGHVRITGYTDLAKLTRLSKQSLYSMLSTGNGRIIRRLKNPLTGNEDAAQIEHINRHGESGTFVASAQKENKT